MLFQFQFDIMSWMWSKRVADYAPTRKQRVIGNYLYCVAQYSQQKCSTILLMIYLGVTFKPDRFDIFSSRHLPVTRILSATREQARNSVLRISPLVGVPEKTVLLALL